jgi:hypothetical protein
MAASNSLLGSALPRRIMASALCAGAEHAGSAPTIGVAAALTADGASSHHVTKTRLPAFISFRRVEDEKRMFCCDFAPERLSLSHSPARRRNM